MQHNAQPPSLLEAGADVDDLARLASSSMSELRERLKALGFSKLGHRIKIESELIALSRMKARDDSHHDGIGARRDRSPVTDRRQPGSRRESDDQPVLSTAQFRVVSAFVNVRMRQSTASEVIAQYDEGQSFEVERREGNWVQPCAVFGGGARGWVMVDGAELGIGRLLRQTSKSDDSLGEAHASEVIRSAPRRPSALQQRLPLLLRAVPVSSEGPLPRGTLGPVKRFVVLRPMTLIYASPSRMSAVTAVCIRDDLVWSCEPQGEAGAVHGWQRLADPDGWVPDHCPAGFQQLEPQPHVHTGRPDREMASLDLWGQVRVAVLQTFGAQGRMTLAQKFRAWEEEALKVERGAAMQPDAWKQTVEQRQLAQSSPFAQGLLSVCHRDVVLAAQDKAIRSALSPSLCAMIRAPDEVGLTRGNVAELQTNHLLIIDNALPHNVVEGCRLEAEALDAKGYLRPPAMHRALGDRRDRLVGIEEKSELLVPGGHLVRLIQYLKSLAAELIDGGYNEALTVPPSIMLACYDGQGAFYKPHMDSMDDDPRLVTAIFYLVDDKWDGRLEADGGNLIWWTVTEDDLESAHSERKKHQLEPKAGRLVVFNSRTVMHEVMPTHRKRFAVTLWFFRGATP